jgi:hypothetical protein
MTASGVEEVGENDADKLDSISSLGLIDRI